MMPPVIITVDTREPASHPWQRWLPAHVTLDRAATITPPHGDMVEHGVSPKLEKGHIRETDGNTMRDHATMQPSRPGLLDDSDLEAHRAFAKSRKGDHRQ